MNVSKYLTNFSDSAIAFGVGASCYIGMKALSNKKYTYAPHFGKAFLGTSAIASLYFAGCFKKDSLFNQYIGASIPIPQLGGIRAGINIETIKEISRNISQVAQDNFKNFQKAWLFSSE